MSDGKPICPKCGAEVPLALVADVKAQSRITISLGPSETQLVPEQYCAEQLGALLTNTSKILKRLAKEQGCKAEVVVEAIRTEGGVLYADLLVARVRIDI